MLKKCGEKSDGVFIKDFGISPMLLCTLLNGRPFQLEWSQNTITFWVKKNRKDSGLEALFTIKNASRREAELLADGLEIKMDRNPSM